MSCNDVCSKLMFEGWTSQYSCTALPLGLNIYIEGTPYDPHLIFVGVYKKNCLHCKQDGLYGTEYTLPRVKGHSIFV